MREKKVERLSSKEEEGRGNVLSEVLVWNLGPILQGNYIYDFCFSDCRIKHLCNLDPNFHLLYFLMKNLGVKYITADLQMNF